MRVFLQINFVEKMETASAHDVGTFLVAVCEFPNFLACREISIN